MHSLIGDSHEALTFGPLPSAGKPSNPKDAIGIRKAPMSTVSAAVLAEVGVAMLEGAAKYGRHNYRAVGVQSSVYYDATMRHLMAWWEGEDTDPDSGMSHITKAITSLVVLRDAMIQGMLTDDRAPRSAEFYTRLNELSAAILDRHADKAPKHYTINDALTAASPEHAPPSFVMRGVGDRGIPAGVSPGDMVDVVVEGVRGGPLHGPADGFHWDADHVPCIIAWRRA